MESKSRRAKAEVTGKITETKKSAAAEPEAVMEPAGKEPEAGGMSKGDMAKNYRDMLQAQVEAKKAAAAHEKEMRKGATGFQTESMSKEADKEYAMSGKTKDQSKERMTAKEIQAFNQQIASQKAAEKMAKKGYEPYPEPAPYEAPPPEAAAPAKGVDLSKAMPQGELESETEARKKEASMKLKEALQAQMAEDKARKLQEKQERMGYKK